MIYGTEFGRPAMARRDRPLTAVEVAKATEPGLLPDRDGLYLKIGATGGKWWVFRFMLDRKAREMGLGSVRHVSLAEAREEAQRYRRMVRHDRIDPIEARRSQRAVVVKENKARITFEDYCENYIDRQAKSWKNPEQAKNWRSSLRLHAYPTIGRSWIDDIDTEDVLKIIEPIWYEKNPLARAIINRMEKIFDDAIVRNNYAGANPARWKGNLKITLPSPTLFYREQHHPSLLYSELPQFMLGLHASNHLGSRALEFLVLTVVRNDEVRGTTWDEIDFAKKLWTIPPERMKGRRRGDRPHFVPLSDTAISLLEAMKPLRVNKYVFAGEKSDKPIGVRTINKALSLLRKDVTPHGFRTTFRSWAEKHPRQDLVELCLAHTLNAAKATGVLPAIRQAYLNEDPELRRPIMDDWAKFAMSEGSVVGPAAE
jgi:integrase